MRNLPPLKALVAFDAVARLQSVSKAGAELGLTQSAISHRLKLLEEYLAESLFVRKGRLLTLTDTGQQFAVDVDRILSELSSATLSIKGDRRTTLRFAVYSAFAMKWLMPALSSFRELHPSLDVRLNMMVDEPELSDSVADIFITVAPNKPGYYSQLLHQERLIPVASPEVIARIDQARYPESLWTVPLLSVENETLFGGEGGDWLNWSEKAGFTIPDSARYYYFSHLILAMEAAINGQGIALASHYMVKKDIEEGRLIHLPFTDIETGYSFYFCCKQSRKREPAIQLIHDWIVGLASEEARHQEVKRDQRRK